MEQTEADATKTEPKPKEAETSESSTNRKYMQLNFQVYVETSEKRAQQENHHTRLQRLRNELNFVKETEWMYDPIEKHIGQS